MLMLRLEASLLQKRFPLVGFSMALQAQRLPLGTTESDIDVITVRILLGFTTNALERLVVFFRLLGFVEVQ